jgi:hypothetical protein
MASPWGTPRRLHAAYGFRHFVGHVISLTKATGIRAMVRRRPGHSVQGRKRGGEAKACGICWYRIHVDAAGFCHGLAWVVVHGVHRRGAGLGANVTAFVLCLQSRTFGTGAPRFLSAPPLPPFQPALPGIATIAAIAGVT